MTVSLFLVFAVIMTLSAVAVIVIPLFREKSGGSPVAAVVSALVIPAVVALLYVAVSNYPWSTPGIAATPPAGPRAADATADTAEITALKDAVAQAPQDVARWVNLGDGYMAQERFSDARDAYRQAISLSRGGDDALRLAMAEASILADRNTLLGEAGQIIEDVLGRDPFNPKALWYGGMAALGRGDAQTAKAHWTKLLTLSPPPRVRQVIEQQLALLGASPGAAAAPPSEVRIPVTISMKAELAQRVKPGAALFLIARETAGEGPPLAVVRRTSPTFPLDLEISDADSMVPGRHLGGRSEIQLIARLANDGEALPASGDVFGEVVWRPAATQAGRLAILMNQVTP